MEAGVSLSLPQEGVHGASIFASVLSLISVPFAREHVSICERNFSGGFNQPDNERLLVKGALFSVSHNGFSSVNLLSSRVQIQNIGFRSLSFTGLRFTVGLSSDLGFLEPSFRSWRTPATGTVESMSFGSPLGSPDPIEEDLGDRLLGFYGYGRRIPVFIGELPVPAHQPKKARSWFLALGLADPGDPVPDESEGLRMLKKASGIGMPGVSFMVSGVSFMMGSELGCRHWILFLMASLRVVGALLVVGYPHRRRWHRLRLPRPWGCGASMLRLCSIDADFVAGLSVGPGAITADQLYSDWKRSDLDRTVVRLRIRLGSEPKILGCGRRCGAKFLGYGSALILWSLFPSKVSGVL